MDTKPHTTYTQGCKYKLTVFSVLQLAPRKMVSNVLVFHWVPTALSAVTKEAVLTLVLKIRMLETSLDKPGWSGNWGCQYTSGHTFRLCLDYPGLMHTLQYYSYILEMRSRWRARCLEVWLHSLGAQHPHLPPKQGYRLQEPPQNYTGVV
jgi:hypothetical protein